MLGVDECGDYAGEIPLRPKSGSGRDDARVRNPRGVRRVLALFFWRVLISVQGWAMLGERSRTVCATIIGGHHAMDSTRF